MGWLWGSGGSSNSQDQLDPSLREFLKKEAPTGQKPALPSKPAETPAEPTRPTATAPSEESQPVVPPQSQFQDGRYAHVWKNYTPQHVLEDRTKTEQDKLRDIVDAYNDRKAEIGRVALENCAMEYMAQYECFQKPDWVQMGSLCNAESKKFNRCYDVQTKILKALGYLTMEYRSAEDSEKIQMHADKLYQLLLEQEIIREKAKKEGKPAPKFESILSQTTIARAMSPKPLAPSPEQEPPAPLKQEQKAQEEDIWSRIKPTSRIEYEKKIAELPEQDREMERQALLGELRAQNTMSGKVEQTFIEERINRMRRREAGQSTIGDTIKWWWGWG